MNIIKNYMKNSPLYKAGTTIKPKGAFIHSVGCPQPKASVFINTMNKATARTGVSAFIQPDGIVYETLPIYFSKKTAIKNWHAGSGKKGNANANWIGVELTEPSTIKYTSGASFKDLDPAKTKAHVAATYKYAVEYFAYLCEGFGWNPLGKDVILSHNEGYKKGYATGHSDVEHIWSKYGYTMNQFRKDVKEKMDENKKAGTKKTTSGTKNITKHFQVIATDGLNIRAGAATNTKKVGEFAFGKCFTISKISANGNWGYIDGKGWLNISSKYVKEISRVQITCSSLNVRAKANVLSKKVCSVAKGTKHYVTRTSGNWGWLATKGWANISSKYVKEI